MVNQSLKNMFILLMILITGSIAAAQDNHNARFGINGMFGGRYDNLRMCVATDAGVKGGPFGDIQFNVRWDKKKSIVVLHIPVMRPILFGAAFQMLQFEPEVTYIFNQRSSSVLFGIGLGTSFHYGPDYKSDLDNRGSDFFAAGPIVSALVGFKFGNGQNEKMPDIRIFYTALYSEERTPGTVLGAALEYSWYF